MSVRELVILGNSAQRPTAERALGGYVLRWDEEGILFDPGEGTQRQMIFSDISATSLSKIFLSHFHADHCLGLAGMCQRISLDRVPHSVAIYYPQSGQVFFERLRKASIYHAAAKLTPTPIAEEGIVYEDKKITIRARELCHGVDCLGYRLEEKPRFTMLVDKLKQAGISGRTIGELQREGQVEVDGQVFKLEDFSVPKPSQSVAVIMDSLPCEASFELLKDADLALMSATYLEKHRSLAEAENHSTAAQAARLAKEAGVKQLVLSNFSPRYTSLDDFKKEAEAIFPGVLIGEADMRIEIPRPAKR